MKIFEHDFGNATAEERKLLDSYFRGYDYRGAEFTFLSIYVWRHEFSASWDIIEGYLCIAYDPSAESGRGYMMIPLTCDGTYEPKKLRAAVEKCREIFAAKGYDLAIGLVPGHMRHFLEDAFPEEEIKWLHDVNNDQYVYEKEKLITLSGRALHKKKNHLNYFLRTYDFESKIVTESMKSDILDLVERLKEVKEADPDEIEDLEGETEAIENFLSHLGEPGVYSTAIFVGGKLEAFALGERLSGDTAVEHFEKADGVYRGLYQLVCREFCMALPDETVYVNREEDMGLANLRQAKEALAPCRMEERYTWLLSK